MQSRHGQKVGRTVPHWAIGTQGVGHGDTQGQEHSPAHNHQHCVNSAPLDHRVFPCLCDGVASEAKLEGLTVVVHCDQVITAWEYAARALMGSFPVKVASYGLVKRMIVLPPVRSTEACTTLGDVKSMLLERR
jgi:hypothetical protein